MRIFDPMFNGPWPVFSVRRSKQVSEVARRPTAHLRRRVTIVLLCLTTLVSGLYAVRQRAWALKLRDQLAETNKDDVKLMELLSTAEKESIIARFRAAGETRIADWIARQARSR